MKSKIINKRKNKNIFEQFASAVTKKAGSTGAFILAFTIVIVWIFSGHFFGYSDTWQLVINTGTTIVTFLMVFLIQKSQNKDSIAVHIKLNELVASNDKASNRMVDVEGLSEDELRTISKYFEKLAELTRNESDVHESHSIDDASDNHNEKMKGSKRSRK